MSRVAINPLPDKRVYQQGERNAIELAFARNELDPQSWSALSTQSLVLVFAQLEHTLRQRLLHDFIARTQRQRLL